MRTISLRMKGGFGVATVTAMLLLAMSFVAPIQDSSAAPNRAPFGAGINNVTLNGHFHEHMGVYLTKEGPAFCIDAGSFFPRTSNPLYGDVPVVRGVGPERRKALSYVVSKWGGTTDNVRAAAVATLAYGLSGDFGNGAPASPHNYNISAPGGLGQTIHNMAISMYDEAMSRTDWVVSNPFSNGWTLTDTLTETAPGSGEYDYSLTILNGANTAVAGTGVLFNPTNLNVPLIGGDSTSGGTGAFLRTTNGSGQININGIPAVNASNPVALGGLVDAPNYYDIRRTPSAGGNIYQPIVLGSKRVYGTASANVPSDKPAGEAHVLKTTDNMPYQTGAGATFNVLDSDGTTVGEFTVLDGSGFSNTLELPVGDYTAVETSSPDGQTIDGDEFPFSVANGETTEVAIQNTVLTQGEIEIVKIDALTGLPIDGATFQVHRSSADDGVFDKLVATVTTGEDMSALEGLAAGTYQITETAPAPGYVLPDNPSVVQHIDWDQPVEVILDNRPTPEIATNVDISWLDGQEFGFFQEGDLDTLAEQANVVGPVGSQLHDVIEISGIGPDEAASGSVSVFGPFKPSEEITSDSCIADMEVWQTDFETEAGSASTESDPFVPDTAGKYVFVATAEVELPGVREPYLVSGDCADINETAIVYPTITTQAQQPDLTDAATVTDLATVTGLGEGTDFSVGTNLFGPMDSTETLQNACESPEIEQPIVGTVTDQHTSAGSPFEATSSPVALPSTGYTGLYYFEETLLVPGFPEISHECGLTSETFILNEPSISTEAQVPHAEPGATVNDKIQVLNLDPGTATTVETSLYGPFASEDDLANACQSGELGAPVGTVTDDVEATEDGGPLTVTTSDFTLPGADDQYAGVYTFVASMKVPGFDNVTHECGEASETFTVQQRLGGGGDEEIIPAAGLPVTGSRAMMLGGIGGILLIGGSAFILFERRRNSTI